MTIINGVSSRLNAESNNSAAGAQRRSDRLNVPALTTEEADTLAESLALKIRTEPIKADAAHRVGEHLLNLL
jgi:hypothetical protein